MTSKIGLILVLGVMARLAGPVLASDFISTSGDTAANHPQAAESQSAKPLAGAASLLELHFHNVPLSDVLEYLSRVAGLIIVSDQSLKQSIDLWSENPVSRNEAVELLNAGLNARGAAAVLTGRKLVIMSADQAKFRRGSIQVGSDPEAIPSTEKLVTQIIPVRSVEVTKLLKDLQPLVPMDAVLVANEAANTLVVTDRQRNIQKLARIIAAIDSTAEDPMAIRIFTLQNSSPADLASLLSELFPDQGSSSGDGDSFAPFAPGRNGGGPGGPPGFGPPGASDSSSGSSSNAQTERLQKRARVIAQADDRTTSLIVVAARSLMPQIERVVEQIDSDPKGRQTVKVYSFPNSSVSSVKQLMADLFQKNTSTSNNRSTTSSQTDALATRLSSQTQQNQQSSGNNSRAGANSSGGGNSLGGGAGSAGGGGPQ